MPWQVVCNFWGTQLLLVYWFLWLLHWLATHGTSLFPQIFANIIFVVYSLGSPICLRLQLCFWGSSKTFPPGSTKKADGNSSFAPYSFLKGGCSQLGSGSCPRQQEDRASSCARGSSDWTWAGITWWERLVQSWGGLPRQAVWLPSLDVFQEQLGVALSAKVLFTRGCLKIGLNAFKICLWLNPPHIEGENVELAGCIFLLCASPVRRRPVPGSGEAHVSLDLCSLPVAVML